MRRTFLAVCLSLFCRAAWGEDVFLSLTRTARPRSAMPTSAAVIGRRDFERTAARTVAEAVEQVPGLELRRTGTMGASELASVRGFGSKQVLVLVDDMPVTPDLTGSVDLGRIPLTDVERIEVLRGGASAAYGPNAEGGVINVITRRPSEGAVSATLSSELRSYGTSLLRGEAGLRRGPFEGSFSGSRDATSGFQQNSDFRDSAFSARAAYGEGTRLRWRANASGSDGSLGLPSGTPVPIGDWDGRRERVANDTAARQLERDRSFMAEGLLRPATGTSLTLRAGEDSADRRFFQYGAWTRIRTEGRSLHAQGAAPSGLVSGYELSQRRLDSDLYGSHRDWRWAVFAQRAWEPARGWTVTPGLRYDRDTGYKGCWSPRLSLVFRPDASWKLSASAARAFQAPTFADLYDPFVPAADRSPGLRPEVSWHYEAGAGFVHPSGFDAKATLFRADVRDRIALDPARSYAAYNLDRAFSQGVEAEVGFRRGPVGQRVSYAYLQAEGLSGGRDYRGLAFSPKHVVSWRAEAEGPWDMGLSGTYRWVGSQFTGAGESGLRIPAHGVAGLRLRKSFGGLEAFAGVENLLDAHYAESADAFNGWYPQAGRSFSGGLTWRFLAGA